MKGRFILVPAILMALAATGAAAQNPAPPAGQGPTPGQGPGPQGFAQRRMQMLLQGITLTAQQQARFDSVQARYAAQMPQMTPGSPPDQATMQQRRELIQRQDAELRAALTPEQQQLWDHNLEQMRQNMPRRP